MFQSIWQQFLKLWRRIKQVFIKSPPTPPPPPPPPPSSSECEQKFMELLEGVANGWSRGTIQGFLIGTKIKNADWENWLQAFGERLLASPELNLELGGRLLRLGEANYGKISEMAGKIGRELLARENQGGEISGEVIREENDKLDSSNPTTNTDNSSVDNQPGSTSQLMTTEIEVNQEAVELFNQATELRKSGNFQRAIALCEQAIKIQPNYAPAWCCKATVLYNLKRYEEARINSNYAIELEPDYYPAWSIMGYVLSALGNYKEAVIRFSKAIELRPDWHPAWQGRGGALLNLGISDNLEHLILEGMKNISYAQELQPNFYLEQSQSQIEKDEPDHQICWLHYVTHARILCKLKRYEEAKLYCDLFLEMAPEDIGTMRLYQLFMREMGLYDKSFQELNRILEIYPNQVDILTEKGDRLRESGCCEEAICEYDKAIQIQSDYWKAWNSRGWAIFSSPTRLALLQRYKDARNNWVQGLRHLNKTNNDHQEGCGRLYYSIGFAFYLQGKSAIGKLEDYLEAKTYCQLAKEYFNTPQLLQCKLEVLQFLMQIHRELNEPKESLKLRCEGSVVLEEIRKHPHFINGDKIALFHKFSCFDQYIVDELIHSGKIIKALEFAEQRKNTCLGWFQHDSNYKASITKYEEIQKLLKPDTAIIYWHLSPVSLTTFILKYKQDPLPLHQQRTLLGIFSKARIDGSTAARQLRKFEEWIKKWKGYYENYQNKKSESEITLLPNLPADTKVKEIWHDQMKDALDDLRDHILLIDEILQYLKSDIKQLILIPHRDLHLLPLEYLFRDHPFTITRLPSAQIGLKLKQENPHPLTFSPLPNLLSIEDPDTKQPMLFAEIESAAIAKLSPNHHRIYGASATQETVKNAVKIPHAIFHFTGHGYHLTNNPLESALKLADQPLTLRDIFDLDLRQYHLVFLSACETGITGKEGLTDEFVGLVSGFLAVGATYVISTLWAVKESSTAWLVINFYQRIDKGIAPAEALKQAKNWLRTLTHGELAKWLRFLALELANFAPGCSESLEDFADEEEIAIMGNDHAPYDHPYYWAGFIITGKVN